MSSKFYFLVQPVSALPVHQNGARTDGARQTCITPKYKWTNGTICINNINYVSGNSIGLLAVYLIHGNNWLDLEFFLFHRQDWTRLVAIFFLFIIFCWAGIIPLAHCFKKIPNNLFCGSTTFIFIHVLVGVFYPYNHGAKLTSFF
jgi:hypothetical protein